MSAQGATLERRGFHLPIWPVLALLVVAAVTVVGVNVIGDVRQAEPVTTVQETDGASGSSLGNSAIPRGVDFTMVELVGVAGIEGSAAAVRELPAVPFHAEGRAHEVELGPASGATVGGPSQSPFGDCQHCKQRR
ncbi:MAG TPA: hypothetical protein VFZ75_12010 [Actinomycetota bacterium]|nr:hypothetical protein [Actinomycetota bacterium]